MPKQYIYIYIYKNSVPVLIGSDSFIKKFGTLTGTETGTDRF